jgi:protein-tyrosine phosphatase
VIDLHIHVLPGLDDGPQTPEEAVALARAVLAAGGTAVAATPHVDRRWAVTVEQIDAAHAVLEEALRAAGVALPVARGAEIALDRLVDLGDDELAQLTLGGTRTLLIECPLQAAPGDFTWPVRRLLSAGWEVLLAHPERSPAFQRDAALLARLIDEGARAQVTAAALTGAYGGVPQTTAFAMLDANLVHVLASDAHDAGRRGPDVSAARQAFEEARPQLAARWPWLTRVTPQAILAGMHVPPRIPVGA